MLASRLRAKPAGVFDYFAVSLFPFPLVVFLPVQNAVLAINPFKIIKHIIKIQTNELKFVVASGVFAATIINKWDSAKMPSAEQNHRTMTVPLVFSIRLMNFIIIFLLLLVSCCLFN
jgi:hypothetical protein